MASSTTPLAEKAEEAFWLKEIDAAARRRIPLSHSPDRHIAMLGRMSGDSNNTETVTRNGSIDS